MNIKNRKPQRRRFDADSKAAKLAYLRELAPSLSGGRRLNIFALVGSIIMVLTVAGLYFTIEIYKTAGLPQMDNSLVEVIPAGDLVVNERKALLARLEADDLELDQMTRDLIAYFETVDLLDPTSPAHQRTLPPSGESAANLPAEPLLAEPLPGDFRIEERLPPPELRPLAMPRPPLDQLGGYDE